MISIILYLLRCVLLTRMWTILVNVPCALQKNVYSTVFWMKLPMDYIQLIDGAVEFSFVLTDFPLAGSVHFWQRGVEVSNYNSIFMYFSWYFCNGLNVYVPHKKSYVEILTPKVMVLGDRTFGRWFGHGGGALMNRISALIKKLQRALLLLLPCEVTAKNSCLWQEVGSHQTPSLPASWSWTSQPAEQWDINVCVYKPLCLWYFCYCSPDGLRQVLFVFASHILTIFC